IDQYVNGSPEEGWPLWMEKKIDEADFVLVVCTKTYLDRVQRKEVLGVGKGVKWEALLTYQDIYENDSLNRKFVPIFFNTTDAKFLPKPLKSVTHYDLSKDDKYEMLCRYLTGQPLAVKPSPDKKLHLPPTNIFPTKKQNVGVDFVDRYLTQKLENALRSFSSQPSVWVSPILSRKSELDKDAKSEPRIDMTEFDANPKSALIKAPPQYGQTSLAHFLVREAWRTQSNSLWLYLDSRDLKPHASSINEAISNELKILGCTEQDIKCVILDSWSPNEKDSFKLLNNLCQHFKNVPIVCMEQVDISLFNQPDNKEVGRQFEVLYLWSLPRELLRKIVADYNAIKYIGDEDAVTARLASDLDVLNLHRTPLNCLTLLKVSEIDFEESPINRTEMI
ncbi:MAG: SEFIR domain-containing protein, partial [Parcubacteria group bacterium]